MALPEPFQSEWSTSETSTYLPPLRRRGRWQQMHRRKQKDLSGITQHWSGSLLCNWSVNLTGGLFHFVVPCDITSYSPKEAIFLEKTSIYSSDAEVWVSSVSALSNCFTTKPRAHSLLTLSVVEQPENIIVCINPLSQKETDFFSFFKYLIRKACI